MTEADILKIDASSSGVQAELQTIALDKDRTATTRVAALRKLEEVGAPSTVPTAESFALDPTRTEDADFLRQNATALLVRHESADEAKAALGRVKASSIDMAILAARLERQQGGH